MISYIEIETNCLKNIYTEANDNVTGWELHGSIQTLNPLAHPIFKYMSRKKQKNKKND